MKQKITFFAVSVLLFIIVFYHQEVGINLGIFSTLVFVMSYYVQRKKEGVNKDYKIAFFGGILSSFSYAYFQDFTSFMVLLLSWHWVAMLMFDPKLQFIKSIIIVPINYIFTLPNLVKVDWGVSNRQIDNVWRKSLAYVFIPLLVSITFVIVYSFASSTVSDFFVNLTFNFNFDPLSIILLTILGGVLMFSFWFFEVPISLRSINKYLPNEFNKNTLDSIKLKDTVIKSGEITFVMLNVILLLFIAIYGYENLFLKEAMNSLSKNVHERVYAVIASILMAIGLILYLYRKELNFTSQNIKLKQLTFSWIILNGVLVLVTFFNNSQYVYKLGLTEKRLGVYAFLILCLIGLYFTFIKIKRAKTNWYLFNKMNYAYYFTFILISVVNWSWVITKYNISTGQIGLAMQYHKSLDYNDVLMYNYFKSKGNKAETNKIEHKLDKQPLISDFDGNLYDSYISYFISKKIDE